VTGVELVPTSAEFFCGALLVFFAGIDCLVAENDWRIVLAPNAAARAQIVPVPKAAKEETDALGSESEIPPGSAGTDWPGRYCWLGCSSLT
jgi:hypothetical protein